MSLATFTLKHPGSCSGMFWRGNPLTGVKGTNQPDWPRNGATLKGIVHNLDKKVEGCDKWLEVKEYKAAGMTSKWQTCPENTWMLFDQGGLLLHQTPS